MARSGAYALRERDPEFAKAWDEAIDEGVEEVEAEAHRRAVEGVDKPITYQGQITATYRDFSDTLRIFLLKAHRPEKYRKRSEVKVEGGDGLAARLAEARRRQALV